MDEISKYYLEQSGGGAGGGELSIGPVYRAGFARGQRGAGFVRDLFRSAWSFVSPLFKSGATALGKQALSTGANILSDAAAGGPDASLRKIAKKRLVEARDTMASKMRGAGRRRRVRRKASSPRKTKVRTKAKTVRRRRKVRRAPRTKMDIFTARHPLMHAAYKRG